MRRPRFSWRPWGCALENISIITIIIIWSSALRLVADGQQRPSIGTSVTVDPLEACRDFVSERTLPGLVSPSSWPWTLDDCITVWTQFVDTVPSGQQQKRSRFIDIWRETAVELRRGGSPCLVHANPAHDGLGSSTIRHLASWVFAEEMGCDWVTPDWGKKSVRVRGGREGEGVREGGAGEGNGTASAAVIYCHRTATADEMDALPRSSTNMQDKRRCTVGNWLSYFRFDVPSVDLPVGGTSKTVQINLRSAEAIASLARVLRNGGGLVGQGWERVVFAFDLMLATEHLCAVGNWDEAKRQVSRKVIGEARDNFHVHPRPWYDDHPNCAYDPARINIALHVRMGDRRAYQQGSPEYFRLLESFMDTVSMEVAGMGLESPIFHVFSETMYPCPSVHTGLFDEFPIWPVALDQIPVCLNTKTSDECPFKRTGRPCSPDRSGIFNVVGTKATIVLHVGHDVQNAMSCMTQADGLLMGCSTFGQVAGLLSRGISFFSMHCSGDRTPSQYKVIPPLAIAERGHMWVPVEGSWRDPVLTATGPLRSALEILLVIRDSSK